MKTAEALLQKALKDLDIKKQEYVRIKAVQLKKQGYKRKEIADILGVSLSAIRDWIRVFNKRGVNALRTKKREDGSRALLTIRQKNALKELLDKKKPKDLGFKDEFWSVKSLAKLVKRKYKITYQGTRSYRRLLNYCGLTLQRAEVEDVRRNDKDHENFKVRFKKKSKTGTITMSW